MTTRKALEGKTATATVGSHRIRRALLSAIASVAFGTAFATESSAGLDPLDMRWTFGAHEPITMYRRKGVRTTGGIEGSSKWVASWLDWFDTESPKLMRELGLNWCHCQIGRASAQREARRPMRQTHGFFP